MIFFNNFFIPIQIFKLFINLINRRSLYVLRNTLLLLLPRRFSFVRQWPRNTRAFSITDLGINALPFRSSLIVAFRDKNNNNNNHLRTSLLIFSEQDWLTNTNLRLRRCSFSELPIRISTINRRSSSDGSNLRHLLLQHRSSFEVNLPLRLLLLADHPSLQRFKHRLNVNRPSSVGKSLHVLRHLRPSSFGKDDDDLLFFFFFFLLSRSSVCVEKPHRCVNLQVNRLLSNDVYRGRAFLVRVIRNDDEHRLSLHCEEEFSDCRTMSSPTS